MGVAPNVRVRMQLKQQWDTDDNLRDVVAARDTVPPKDVSLMDIEVGSECEVLYEGRLYKAHVLAIGKL